MRRHKVFLASCWVVYATLSITEDLSAIDQQLMQLQQEEYQIQELIEQQSIPTKKNSNQDQIIPNFQDSGDLPQNISSVDSTTTGLYISNQPENQAHQNLEYAAEVTKNKNPPRNNSSDGILTLGSAKVETNKNTKPSEEDFKTTTPPNDELLKVKAELEKKKDDLARVNAENVSLQAKLKMYEEEIRKLSETIDELNKKTLVNNDSPSASRNVSMQFNNTVNEDRFNVDRALPLRSISAGTVVYAGPSVSSSVVTRIYEDTMLPVYETSGNWVRVITPQGIRGWVHQSARPDKKPSTDDEIEKRALENWIMIGR